MAEQETKRTIARIAGDIKRIWVKPYFGAVPYLNAMLSLETSADSYGMDSADDILLRFFTNASGFRGEKAKILKFELAHHLSPKYQKDFLKKYRPKEPKSTR